MPFGLCDMRCDARKWRMWREPKSGSVRKLDEVKVGTWSDAVDPGLRALPKIRRRRRRAVIPRGMGHRVRCVSGWMTHVVGQRAARGKAGVSGWSSLLVYPCLSNWTSLLSRSTVSRDGPTVVYLAEGANAYIVTRARASVS